MIDIHDDKATHLDPDETKGLLLNHIITRNELNRWEQENINEAIDWLNNSSPKNIDKLFSVSFIRQLHKKMFGVVWKWAGNFRKVNKNIGIPFWKISVELKKLCDDTKEWINKKIYAPDEIALRFHHRLVQVHLFPNGNGRHARLMADLLIEIISNKSRFTWGGPDLFKSGKCRDEYIKALREADKSNFDLLLKFSRTSGNRQGYLQP